MEFNEVEYTEEETAFREEMHEKILDHMAEKDYRPARFKELKNFLILMMRMKISFSVF